MKTTKIILASIMAIILCLGLASCAKKLSGTYSAEVLGSGAEYKFSGSKVTISIKALGASVAEVEGKYSIDGDKITFEFESEDEEVKKYSGTFDFKEEDDSIKIGVITYKKK